jgi:hypothetical protein
LEGDKALTRKVFRLFLRVLRCSVSLKIFGTITKTKVLIVFPLLERGIEGDLTTLEANPPYPPFQRGE